MSWFAFLTHALEICILLPSAYLALMPVGRWFRYPRRTVYVTAFMVCLLAAAAGGLVCATFDWSSYWFVLLFLPVGWSIYCVTVNLELGKKLFCFCNAAMMGAYATVLTNVLMAPMEASNSYGAFLPVSSFICLVVMEMIMVLFDNTLTIKLPSFIGEQVFNKAWNLLWLGPFLLMVFLVWMNPISYEVMLSGRVRPVSIGFLLFMLLTFWIVYHLFWQMNTSLIKSERLRLEGDLSVMEQKRYAALRNYMQQTSALRHELRHHLMAIDELAQSGDSDALKAYLAPLVASAQQTHPQLCANPSVDALAAHLAQQAKQQQTSIAWRLALTEDLPVEEADVCAVLGNLVENALTAVRELPVEQRKVEVSASMPSDSLLGITVKNPYKGMMRLTRRGLPRRARGERGVGLISVSTIARKHNGIFEATAKDGRYEVGVLLVAGNEG